MYSNNYLYYFCGNELSFLINKNSKTIWLNEEYWLDKTKSGEYINKKLNLYDYDFEYCDFEYINNMKKSFL